MPRWLFVLLLFIIILLFIGVILTRVEAYAAVEQPIDYSHKTHVDAGIQCLFCHTAAMRSDIAGIPSVEKCMGCHRIISSSSSEIQLLADYWERGEPIPWKRVNKQPDFVFFSHQVHISNGLNCETCHGTVGSMTVTQPAGNMDMGWCLKCHFEEPEEKIARLTDCLACHK